MSSEGQPADPNPSQNPRSANPTQSEPEPEHESDPESPARQAPRLGDVTTYWSDIRSLRMAGEVRQRALETLIGRYHDAIENYLAAKLRDRDLADEVRQQFWAKVIEGKLAGADESKGRFRDYVRTVIHRLIIDHYRKRKTRPLPPQDLVDPAIPDREYDSAWREAVLSRVRSRLETFEILTPNNRYHTVLALREQHPEAPIEDLAKLLADRDGKPVSPENYRKILQRARAKFLELLRLELRDTIHPATDEDVESEIHDLGLGDLIRRYGKS